MKLKIKLEKREHAGPLLKLLIPVISILLAFVFIGVILKFMGYSPVKAYTYVFKGAFGSA